MMNAAAPEGTPPRRIKSKKFQTPSCPAVPRRGPEAGNHHKITGLNDFFGLGETIPVHSRSFPFQQFIFSFVFFPFCYVSSYSRYGPLRTPDIHMNCFFGDHAHEQTLIILHPKLGQMVNGIVLPIKKVFGLVDSKISVEIKDEEKKLQGRLVAVDEYLNIHMEETIEFVNNQRGRSLGTVVIRGNNILTIAPLIS
jgi:small nuclear ribonucleoprotein (snRNP)-like protein